MPKHQTSWLERWIFWKSLLCPLYVWPRPQRWEASLRSLCRQGGRPAACSFFTSIYIKCVPVLTPAVTRHSGRFLFILLGPHGKTKSYNEIGRAIATLMVDDVSGRPCSDTLNGLIALLLILWFYFRIFRQLFSDVAYKARDRDDLIAGVDEFLDEVIVLPPGEWDPKIRIEPPKKVPSAEMRHVHSSIYNPIGCFFGHSGK